MALGFGACTTEQPDLYGPPPVLYGPLPIDSTQIDSAKSESSPQKIQAIIPHTKQ